MKIRKSNNRGFTLIEVVLVLAIGGLIFLLAFLAFQQASINRRDTQRREDAAKILSEVTNWQADHGGKVPCGNDLVAIFTCVGNPANNQLTQFVSGNLGGMKDPSTGSAYVFAAATYTNVGTAPTSTGNVVYSVGSKCATDGSNTFIDNSSGGTNFVSVAVMMKLEKGIICKDINN